MSVIWEGPPVITEERFANYRAAAIRWDALRHSVAVDRPKLVAGAWLVRWQPTRTEPVRLRLGENKGVYANGR